MKKIVIAIVGVLLLAGLGAGGYFMMADSKPSNSEAEEIENPHKDSFPGRYKKYSALSSDVSPKYFVIEDVVVNFNGEGQAKYLATDINLMSYYPELVSEGGDLESLKPIVMNDIQKLLRGKRFSELNTIEGPEKLRAELLDTVRAILEKHNIYPDTLEDVYLVRFVMQ
jgi:flagellar FliL protein